MWRSLVNVNHIKTAISTLRTCNWLYRDVLEQCIDESTKHIIEVSNNATTKMLKKASPEEVDAFQAYTIRNLDNKVSTSSDIEQYKLLHVTEEPVSNRQQHLDIMCFTVLFPNGKLPNHKIFDPEIESQREDYYYSLVLLFCPFRDESSLILGNETAEQAFYRLLSNQSSSHHAKLKTMLAAASTVKVINDARQAEKLEEKEVEDDDEPQVLGEARTAMSDVLDMHLSSHDQLTLDEREPFLNADQRRVFDTVKTHLLHERSHENNKCSCNDLKPLRLFISGVGDTGKSFLIEIIKILLTSMWNSDDLLCAVAAPTGLAAFNVGGVTMHRLFQLPIQLEQLATGPCLSSLRKL